MATELHAPAGKDLETFRRELATVYYRELLRRKQGEAAVAAFDTGATTTYDQQAIEDAKQLISAFDMKVSTNASFPWKQWACFCWLYVDYQPAGRQTTLNALRTVDGVFPDTGKVIPKMDLCPVPLTSDETYSAPKRPPSPVTDVGRDKMVTTAPPRDKRQGSCYGPPSIEAMTAWFDTLTNVCHREWVRAKNGESAMVQFERKRCEGAEPAGFALLTALSDQLLDACSTGKALPGQSWDTEKKACVLDIAKFACFARWYGRLNTDQARECLKRLRMGLDDPWNNTGFSVMLPPLEDCKDGSDTKFCCPSTVSKDSSYRGDKLVRSCSGSGSKGKSNLILGGIAVATLGTVIVLAVSGARKGRR